MRQYRSRAHAAPDASAVVGAYGSGRVTPQRASIAACADRLPGAFTVDKLAACARGADASLGTATVYRAVAAMEASGWLERVGERGGSALFARCGAGGHHHHVVCDGCGRVAVAECPVAVTPGDAAGFVVTRHEVTLYGLCPTCAAGSPGTSRGSEG